MTSAKRPIRPATPPVRPALSFYWSLTVFEINGRREATRSLHAVNWDKPRPCGEPDCKDGARVYDSASVIDPWDGNPPTYGVVHPGYIERELNPMPAEDVPGMLAEAFGEFLEYHASR